MYTNLTHEFSSLKNGQKVFACASPFKLKFGGQLDQLACVFETFGELNAQRDNAILVHHALSSSSHIVSSDVNPTGGWWEKMVGPGLPIDTSRYFVICINNLGSCYGTTGPKSINPRTGKSYQADFPEIHMEDMVNAQCLVLDALKINVCHTVIGPSMGGMLSLTMAALYPHRMQRLLLIATPPKPYPVNIALRAIQKDAVRLDPAWQNGFYQHNPEQGFCLARQLGHMTYRNSVELNERFAQAKDKGCILEYLHYNSKKFVTSFDANSYLTLLTAMDNFDAFSPSLHMKSLKAKIRIISIDTDTLFPPYQQEELFGMMKALNLDVEFIKYNSTFGHDAFLVETEKTGAHIQELLQYKPALPSLKTVNFYNSRLHVPAPSLYRVFHHAHGSQLFSSRKNIRYIFNGMRKII